MPRIRQGQSAMNEIFKCECNRCERIALQYEKKTNKKKRNERISAELLDFDRPSLLPTFYRDNTVHL